MKPPPPPPPGGDLSFHNLVPAGLSGVKTSQICVQKQLAYCHAPVVEIMTRLCEYYCSHATPLRIVNSSAFEPSTLGADLGVGNWLHSGMSAHRMGCSWWLSRSC